MKKFYFLPSTQASANSPNTDISPSGLLHPATNASLYANFALEPGGNFSKAGVSAPTSET